MTREPEYPVVVTARREIAERVVELRLEVTDGETPKWQPGAHIDLILGPELVRQYSLCGDPADRSGLTIAVLREIDGRGGSAHVHDRVAVGDRLQIRGPRNNFPLRDAEEYLFIAGGIGITPLAPMIREVAARGGHWSLVYGGRTRGSLAYAADLSDLGEVVLRPQDEYGLLDLDTLLGSPRVGLEVYCCGPEPLLAAVESRCAEWPAGALHLERFAPKTRDSQAAQTEFEVECARSGVTVRVTPGMSILAAVENAGIEVLSSCREGTCGTCETVVLEGIPEHRDSLLTPAEQDSGEIMMICCSRARGPRLVLDL